MAVAAMSVKERLHSLLAHINDMLRSFALLKTVTVIAVTKKHTVESILEAYQAGQKDFGENYVQELADKAQHRDLRDLDIRWHFIGHLQSNKCGKLCAIPNLHGVHSVDSKKLATSLNQSWVKRTSDGQQKLVVFIQVNTSSEESKSGVSMGVECVELVQHIILNCEALDFNGLMTIGSREVSHCERPNEDFSRLEECRQHLCQSLGLKVSAVKLNMGMTADYPEAIRQDTDVVRIGTAIFGERT